MNIRKTKIIATLGPATEGESVLGGLMDAGVNVFRLNMSHAAHDWVREVSSRIRKLAGMKGRHVAILMDTQGPAIRTGDLPTKLDLKAGDIFTFTVRGHKSEEEYSVDTNYDDLVNDIKVGDHVLVDNGVIEMLVKEKRDKELVCEVMTPGTMGSRRHINLPGVKVNLPALTEKDLADLEVGAEVGVDIVALSFVRQANDISLLRQVLASKGREDVLVVAKIEDQSAVRNINEIIDASDAIMVARGDLGIECPYEELPIIQRRIVKKCVTAGKPVIVATHMLESMISSPSPTRAEITDVANAVFEEADAIMLSGETTVGKYPRKCVEVLDRVARRIERSGTIEFHKSLHLVRERDKVAASAVHMANHLPADGICVFSHRGMMPAICAALRPRHCPIFAFTPYPRLANRLALRYGIIPVRMDLKADPAETIIDAEKVLLDQGLLGPGARVVVVTLTAVGDRLADTVQLRVLGGAGEGAFTGP
ncbi:MAG: pyruvate kinase [Verrucomicrobiia bacterium]